jgi:predicted deacylase
LRDYRSVLIVVAGWVLFEGMTAAQSASFVLGGQTVPPGARTDIELQIPAGATDPATYIPVTVFHGTSDGPVLALTMGVHGYEYPSILAGQELLTRINPKELKGTIVLVRLAHVQAFENRVPYVNPHDRKNLNRVFPGKADGTQSERIAWALTTDVVRRCDMHVEVHSGDGAEWLEAFVGIYGGKLAANQYATSRTMGLAFGLQNIVNYSMDTQDQVDRGRSLNRQAVADGKPTILIEIGENGRRDQAFVDPIVNGVENLLHVLGMTPGTPAPQRTDTRWFDGTVSADAAFTGILTPVAAVGRSVRKGESLAQFATIAAGSWNRSAPQSTDMRCMDWLAHPSRLAIRSRPLPYPRRDLCSDELVPHRGNSERSRSAPR